MSNDARAKIAAIAEAMRLEGIDAHARGMSLTQSSARLEQLSRLVADSEAPQCLEILFKEGLVETLEDGTLRLTAKGACYTFSPTQEIASEDAWMDSLQSMSKGGKA